MVRTVLKSRNMSSTTSSTGHHGSSTFFHHTNTKIAKVSPWNTRFQLSHPTDDHSYFSTRWYFKTSKPPQYRNVPSPRCVMGALNSSGLVVVTALFIKSSLHRSKASRAAARSISSCCFKSAHLFPRWSCHSWEPRRLQRFYNPLRTR